MTQIENDVLDSVDRVLTPAETQEMIAKLRLDPESVRMIFPGISQVSPGELPEQDRPLVLIPRSEAWTDS